MADKETQPPLTLQEEATKKILEDTNWPALLWPPEEQAGGFLKWLPVLSLVLEFVILILLLKK